MSASSGPRNFRFQLSCIALLDFFLVWPKPNDSLDFFFGSLFTRPSADFIKSLWHWHWAAFLWSRFFLFVCLCLNGRSFIGDVCWCCCANTNNELLITYNSDYLLMMYWHDSSSRNIFFWAYYLPCSELDDFMVCMTFIEGKISTEIFNHELRWGNLNKTLSCAKFIKQKYFI